MYLQIKDDEDDRKVDTPPTPRTPLNVDPVTPQTPRTTRTPQRTPPVEEEIFYSVTFEDRPFGLILKASDEDQNTGAVVQTDHATRDISRGSRVISINGIHCKTLHFERIKHHCRKAQFPATIKFSKVFPIGFPIKFLIEFIINKHHLFRVFVH